GQSQYANSRKVILSGVDGIVFVADSSPSRLEANHESMADLRTNLKEYDLSLDALPWVIQYNKRDMPNSVSVAQLEAELNMAGVPSHEAVAIQGTGVTETLRALSAQVLDNLYK
ncbi:MAG: gliding-motility protein MglA, partial [Cyanobacteria bacterium REEB65]|nr:gliding-motility protein MglA [Cyanobacteria bacterium REEB65]